MNSTCPSGYDCTLNIAQSSQLIPLALIIATTVVVVAIVASITVYYWRNR